MNKIYEKNELNFALIWIGIYVVSLSISDSISGSIGTAKLITTPVCIVLTLIIYLWIQKTEYFNYWMHINYMCIDTARTYNCPPHFVKKVFWELKKDESFKKWLSNFEIDI